MSQNTSGWLKYLIVALVIGFILLTPRRVERPKAQSKADSSSWFQQTVHQEKKPVFVKFGAEWCGPCRKLDGTMETVEPELQGRWKFVRVDVDEHPSLASEFRVSAIPHSFIMYQGKVVDQRTGSMDDASLKDWLAESTGKLTAK
ncbi:MAG: thioredoxin family protein [Pirellula sp.]|jgi:thioredoxin|nr:thioredoxin family protein [Pirellula sp.]